MEDFNISESQNQGRIQKGWLEQSPPPPKTYKSNFIHHDFAQFETQHSRYRATFFTHTFSGNYTIIQGRKHNRQIGQFPPPHNRQFLQTGWCLRTAQEKVFL